MQSKWSELKPAVVALRRQGKSITFIETHLGVPRSTLHGWCKEIVLNPEQRAALSSNSHIGLAKARVAATERHRMEKQQRLDAARKGAAYTLASIELTPEVLELALAVLYWGEGKKTQATALGTSDPTMLLFFLTVIELRYGIQPERMVYELHLRQDQDSTKEILYWSQELGVPTNSFRRTYFDKRTKGDSYSNYHGVCLAYCPDIAIQRKLVYLYKSFVAKVVNRSGD